MLASVVPPAADRPLGPHGRYLALVRGQRRGPLAALGRLGLWALSLPYGAAVRLRNLAYDLGWLPRGGVEVPVISVGNLTTGGTGKTPCVEYVAGYFRDRDYRVCILSRGYGAEQGANDEFLVLADLLPDVPHLQGADRLALARTAIEELESQVLVLDDGFQHRRLIRDVNLVLIDATCPWGHGHLLPRGLLREPASGLRRADAVIVTRCDQAEAGEVEAIRRRVEQLAPGRPIAETVHEPVELLNASGASAPLHTVHGRRVGAFCGIGNPEAFRRTLLDLGATDVDLRIYPDHHAYTRADVEALRAWAGALPAGAIIVTTQKDLVKLRLDDLAGRALWAPRVRLRFRRGEAVVAALLARVAPKEE